jgi:3-isopropylmalate/(R)-2-methylmalate dehydratase large subunit
VGTTDLEVGILKGVCAFKKPKSVRVNVTGTPPRGVFAKDIILAVVAKLGVNGATDQVVEFHGPVVDSMSMEGRMTVCNMAVEAGATSGICMPDKVTVDYLWPFIGPDGYGSYTNKAEALADFGRWRSDEGAEYTKTVELDCSALEPLATVDYKPDQVRTIRELSGVKVDQVYIGSCTNGRIEDLREAARVIRGGKISERVRAIVSPATPDVYRKALSEGLIADFMAAGFCVTNPTCGACLGMSNGVLAEGEVCASTTNRNFYGRMGKGGMVHLMSPASAAAAALTGYITAAAG